MNEGPRPDQHHRKQSIDAADRTSPQTRSECPQRNKPILGQWDKAGCSQNQDKKELLESNSIRGRGIVDKDPQEIK